MNSQLFLSQLYSNLDDDWQNILNHSLDEKTFHQLNVFLEKCYSNTVVYPKCDDVFNALKLTPFKKIKIVILGQDPYHEPGQAHGLAFSVEKNIKHPPSLKNIFKEIGIKPFSGNLSSWAKQGVLLLNSVLTVEKGKAASHAGQGWEQLTNSLIKAINEQLRDVIFVLWGNSAKEKEQIIDCNKHHILKSVHPSPLSAYRGFFGCNHFYEMNKILEKMNQPPINWEIPKSDDFLF